MIKTAIKLATLLLIVLTAGCSRDREKPAVLAQVGDRLITMEDFVQRAEFSPERFIDGKEAGKQELLEALIAEKLLAIEAEHRRLDQSPQMRQLTQFIEDLAVMRALFKNKVQSRIHLDPAQVQQAMAFSRQERKISWLSFRDKTTAEAWRQKWRSSSLQKVLQELQGGQADTLQHQRSVTWGENDPALEAAIFSLTPGALSPVLEQNGAFLVVRCDDISQNVVATATSDADLKTKVERVLTARQETQLSRRFVADFMQQQQVVFDEKRVRRIIDRLVDLLFGDKSSMALEMKEIPVSKSVWQAATAELAAMQDEEVVRFKGGSLSAGDLLARWRRYRFPVDKSARAACARSLNDQFSLVIRDVLLTREGRRRGLHKQPEVQKDKTLWQDYYLAERLADDVGKTGLSSLLSGLRETTAIRVDEPLLQKTELTDIPVIALRPGQYASRVTPPWPVFSTGVQ